MYKNKEIWKAKHYSVNLKLKEEIPEKVSLFSDKAPSSSGQIYGHRLLTEEAKQMAQMEQ